MTLYFVRNSWTVNYLYNTYTSTSFLYPHRGSLSSFHSFRFSFSSSLEWFNEAYSVLQISVLRDETEIRIHFMLTFKFSLRRGFRFTLSFVWVSTFIVSVIINTYTSPKGKNTSIFWLSQSISFQTSILTFFNTPVYRYSIQFERRKKSIISFFYRKL